MEVRVFSTAPISFRVPATISYIYDPKSRLTRATGDFGAVAQEDYGYDDNDNRLSLEQRDVALAPSPTTVVTSAITAGTNRLASTTATQGGSSLVRTLSYNGGGDIASELRDSVAVTTSYDAYGRLTSYARAGTPPQSMLYSGSDERVQVTTDTTPRRYVYDESGRLIGEYGATGTVHAEHVWLMPDADEGGWEPLALLGPASVSYVHGDHLGVPVLITDGAGHQVNAMQAEPFGRRFNTASAAPRTSLAFPGQIIDIADRHYNLYRDYDPTLGRYLQADPIGLSGGDNVYGYVGGNPVNRVDPRGLTWEDIEQMIEFARCTQKDLSIPDFAVTDLSRLDSGGRKVLGFTPSLMLFSKPKLSNIYLRQLNSEQRFDLFDTIVHESMHYNYPPYLRSLPYFIEMVHKNNNEAVNQRVRPYRDMILSGKEVCGCQ